MIRKTLLVLLAILVVIQFFHPSRNKSTAASPTNITLLYPVSTDVKAIMEKACLDCHSNNTRYRWYFNIQPVDWWLASHVNGGKEALNFDEFTSLSIRDQYHKLKGVANMVKKGHMPLRSYLWIHKDAILTDNEKDSLVGWATAITAGLDAKYPADSLNRKQP